MATSAGMKGRMVGLPVQAVVWTQKGQWQEMPSKLSLALANALLISLALFRPLSAWSMKFDGCAPEAPDFFAYSRNAVSDFAPCWAPSILE